jgi:hypothetical protein
MKDTPDEIASVMNLILPIEEQLPTGEKFISKFLHQQGLNLYTVKKKMIVELKSKFKGRVSFLKAMQSTVKKEFIGKKNIGELKHFIVDPIEMSEYQTSAYEKAVALDKIGKAGVYTNARQAALFVFPTDKMYGSEGFAKYLDKKYVSKTFAAAAVSKDGNKKVKPLYSFSLKPSVINAIKGKTDKETLKNLYKYSSKYAYVIQNILDNPKQTCFVYSELVTGSGSIVFAELLKLFGFSSTKGNEGQRHGLRYGLLTSETSSSKQISNIINCFNQKENKHGDIIRVLIGSKVVSEGVSFYNIQHEFILTPWFNYSETDQAIARGYRLNSHAELIANGEEPIVRIYQMVAMPVGATMSIDLHMYETSEDKDIIIRFIMRLLMESAFDCSLNYFRNHTTGEDGERGCDYQKCDYLCDGVDIKNIEFGVPEDEIDNSTYQLYYSDPTVTSIRKKLDKLFKKHSDFDIETIVKHFEGEYTESEIKNALKTIIDKSDEKLYSAEYINIYYRSNIKKIMIGIENIFHTHFRLSFENITKSFKENTSFEVLTALKNIIDESIVIKNKYGFSSYLRENKNIYFLVNSLSINQDSFSEYYARVPNIVNDYLFSDILYNIQIELLPNFIKMIGNITDSNIFAKMIKSIPIEIQEIFIESAVTAENKKIKIKQGTRKLVLEYFTSYIHQLDDVWVSNRLSDKDVLRCLKDDVWDECPEEYWDKLEKRLIKRQSSLEKNPWGYYGKYNPENGIFSIVNIIAQSEKMELAKKTKLDELNIRVNKKEITEKERDELLETLSEDFRKKYPGKSCMSWNIPQLLNIGINILKLDFPSTFKSKDSESDLRELARTNKHIIKMYSDKEFEKLNKNEIRRALYYTSNSSKRKQLCTEIEKWMGEHKWDGFDMLIPDTEAGIQGGHKKKINKDAKTNKYRIETIIPERNPEKFKSYLKDIQKLMFECFKILKFVPDIDKKEWIIVFLRKKIVGFLIIDTDNIIWKVCVATNYRRNGIAREALQKAVESSCKVKNPRLEVDNKGKTYTKLINLYTEYGFTTVKDDGKYTTMEFKCL